MCNCVVLIYLELKIAANDVYSYRITVWRFRIYECLVRIQRFYNQNTFPSIFLYSYYFYRQRVTLCLDLLYNYNKYMFIIKKL